MTVGLVCKHVALEQAPVCLVSRQAPQDPDDSGLSVACWGEHDGADWLVEDVEEYLPEDLGELPQEEHRATRPTPGQPWIVEPIPAEDEAA